MKKPITLNENQEADRECIRSLIMKEKPTHYGIYLTETGAVVGIMNPDDLSPNCTQAMRVIEKVYL